MCVHILIYYILVGILATRAATVEEGEEKEIRKCVISHEITRAFWIAVGYDTRSRRKVTKKDRTIQIYSSICFARGAGD